MMNSCAPAGRAIARSKKTAPGQEPLRRPRDNPDAFRSFMSFPSPRRSRGYPYRCWLAGTAPTRQSSEVPTRGFLEGEQIDVLAPRAGENSTRGGPRPRAPPGARLVHDARVAPDRSPSLAEAGGVPDRGDGGDALPARGG